MAEHTSHSKVELQAELDNPRIVACRDDATEVASMKDLPGSGINAAARGKEGIQVADGIRKVWVIK